MSPCSACPSSASRARAGLTQRRKRSASTLPSASSPGDRGHSCSSPYASADRPAASFSRSVPSVRGVPLPLLRAICTISTTNSGSSAKALCRQGVGPPSECRDVSPFNLRDLLFTEGVCVPMEHCQQDRDPGQLECENGPCYFYDIASGESRRRNSRVSASSQSPPTNLTKDIQ